MKIYTKTGDKGQTSLIGGTRVPKHHIRIEAYGTLDELNSWLGLIRDQDINQTHQLVLTDLQHALFCLGSQLAADPEASKMKLPDVNPEDVQLLENQIDWMNERLPELKNFILPGGNTPASYCHIARCVCRRTERLITQLDEINPVNPLYLAFINRLSDYLFTLARKLCYEHNNEEILWKTRS